MTETKDHQNWELLGQAAEKLQGAEGKTLKEACEQVEDQEDGFFTTSCPYTR